MLSFIKSLRWLFAIVATVVASPVFAHGMSEAEQQLIIDGGNLGYLWIGAVHMLSGYDHLAFVFGIIFFLTRFKDIVKYVTAFTIGHSITLIAATFLSIQVNYFLIDAVIALSVCYIAFHNLDGFKKTLNIAAPNMLVMIVCFGLIHGLGLSTRLQQLPLNPDQLLLNIISFNVGVELGQIAALAAMLLLMAAFRKSHWFPVGSKLSNYFLVFAGVYLFLMQMHGYEHSINGQALAVSDQPNGRMIAEQPSPQGDWTDVITVVIPAAKGKEYKFQLKKGATLDYSWTTEKGALFYDFHGEPKGDTSGYFKTFEKDTQSRANGSLTTLFEGTHGWYWKNDNAFPVVVKLYVAGDYQRMDLLPEW